MADETVLAEYNCTQQELYSIGDTIYDNLEQELPAFTAYKSKYNAAFLATLRGKITHAKAMPDEESRNAKYRALKQQLIPLGVACTDLFQDLKGYIKDGFPESEQAAMNDAAGQTYMANALNKNWENVVGLNTQMKKFVVDYVTQLTAGFMPATFAAKITTASDSFDATYKKFKKARQTGVETDARVTLNNDINKDISDVNEDGQRVMKNDASRQRLFMFSVVKDIVSPPGSASLKLDVFNEATDEPIAGVDVTIKAAGGVAKSGQTDATGKVQFTDVDPATYNCSLKKVGFSDLNFVKEVNTGTAARKEAFMVAAP